MKPVPLPFSRSRPPSGRLAFLLAAAALTLGGCAARGATLGDEISEAGAEYERIAERWDEAEDQVSKGRKLVARGRDRVRDGEDDIERGERLVRDGEREMQRGERDYERLKARSGAGVGPAPGQ